MPNKTLANNYAREAVPDTELVSGVTLAVVLIGLMLTLPMFVLGGELLTGLTSGGGRLCATAEVCTDKCNVRDENGPEV